MEIIDRIGDFRADNRYWYTRKVDAIKKNTVHHTGSRAGGSHEDILNALFDVHHGKNDWPGIGYHFVIMKDGAIYQLNEFTEVTWHDTHNWDSIGIALHGYFHPEYDEVPTAEQLKALDWLLDRLCTQHPEFPADHDDVLGHRERSSTACPGNHLFPKVVEYRTNLGDVDWEAQPCIGLSDDLPTFVEDKYELKEKGWYSKYWTLDEFISFAVSELDKPVDPSVYFKLSDDIPTEVEEEYGLKEKTWYNKHWSFGEFIEYCVRLGQGETAYRAFLHYINAKLTGLEVGTPKSVKEEEADLQHNADVVVQKLEADVVKDLSVFSNAEIREEFTTRTLTGIVEALEKLLRVKK